MSEQKPDHSIAPPPPPYVIFRVVSLVLGFGVGFLGSAINLINQYASANTVNTTIGESASRLINSSLFIIQAAEKCLVSGPPLTIENGFAFCNIYWSIQSVQKTVR